MGREIIRAETPPLPRPYKGWGVRIATHWDRILDERKR